MKNKGIITAVTVTFAVVIFISLIVWYLLTPAPVLIQGEVEVRSMKVSSKLTGRIEGLYVKEGQWVSKGELLFVLSTPEIEAKLSQASAAKNAAGAQQQKAIKGARKQEIEGAYNLWQKALAGLELAQKSYDRVKNLYDAGVVPAQKLDEATANLKAMKTTTTAAKSQYEMATEGARVEDKIAAGALVDQAQGVISEIESYKSDACQSAPFSGEVGSVIAEQGELISSGYPIITLLDLNDMWVSFNIKEDLLPKIKMGTIFKAYVPAIDKTIDMKVSFMASQADYATWSATKSKGGFDIRTFEVRATPLTDKGEMRPGMTAVVNWSEM